MCFAPLSILVTQNRSEQFFGQSVGWSVALSVQSGVRRSLIFRLVVWHDYVIKTIAHICWLVIEASSVISIANCFTRSARFILFVILNNSYQLMNHKLSCTTSCGQFYICIVQKWLLSPRRQICHLFTVSNYARAVFLCSIVRGSRKDRHWKFIFTYLNNLSECQKNYFQSLQIRDMVQCNAISYVVLNSGL